MLINKQGNKFLIALPIYFCLFIINQYNLQNKAFLSIYVYDLFMKEFKVEVLFISLILWINWSRLDLWGRFGRNSNVSVRSIIL